MSVYEKLLNIQGSLKAPKGQYNGFGKYKYRSCEDILEALKPLLVENKAVVTINDSLVQVGERYYVQAIATLIDIENGEKVNVMAYARESASKKGMDESQVTGATSSYARKYALNGLFAIDDNKDMDYMQGQYTDENKGNNGRSKAKEEPKDYWAKAHHERVTSGAFEGLTLIEVEKDSPAVIDEWYKLCPAGDKKMMLKAIIDSRK